jgi:hypothetical protein
MSARVIHASSLDWLRDHPDARLGSMITDPPERTEPDALADLMARVDGPVVMLAPLVAIGEPFPRSMDLPSQPHSVLRWWAKIHEMLMWGSIYVWNGSDDGWTEPTYDLTYAVTEDSIERARKPQALFDALVKAYGRSIVLDPFAGSGVTATACESLGLDSLSIDIDVRCCEHIRGRIPCCSAT